MTLDAAEVWDRFEAARRARPEVTPEEFADELAERLGAAAAEVRALLATALGLEELRPTPPLVEPGGEATEQLAFAGYRLERELGRGGFGIVYEAVGAGGEVVALKVLNPLTTVDPRRRKELLREARVAAELEHEGLVRVLGSGLERGYAWIAFERVEGVGLDELPDLPGSEREARALDLGLQFAEALAHAHARGVVHRDLKPGNVLATPDGRAKVLDLGLASADRAAVSVSLSGELIGTPLFMAPEQLRPGGAVGPWSDVYALGLLAPRPAARAGRGGTRCRSACGRRWCSSSRGSSTSCGGWRRCRCSS